MLCVVFGEQSLRIHGRQNRHWCSIAAVGVAKRRFCQFVSLSARRAARGDVLAPEDIGRDSDSRLSWMLIRCNFAKPARGPRHRARAASERLGIVASINKLVAHR
jgi:hypothetical protein